MHSSGPNAMAINIYNKLPNQIKNIDKTNIFENKLKELLIQKCYHTVDEYINDDNLNDDFLYRHNIIKKQIDRPAHN